MSSRREHRSEATASDRMNLLGEEDWSSVDDLLGNGSGRGAPSNEGCLSVIV
jgi:hypothetical protein